MFACGSIYNCCFTLRYYIIFRLLRRTSNKSRYLSFISFDKKLALISDFQLGIADAIVSRTLSTLLVVNSHLSIIFYKRIIS